MVFIMGNPTIRSRFAVVIRGPARPVSGTIRKYISHEAKVPLTNCDSRPIVHNCEIYRIPKSFVYIRRAVANLRVESICMRFNN